MYISSWMLSFLFTNNIYSSHTSHTLVVVVVVVAAAAAAAYTAVGFDKFLSVVLDNLNTPGWLIV